MWSAFFDTIRREPVATSYAVRAMTACGVSFGLGWTAEQVTSFMIMVEAVFTVLVRSRVTPDDKTVR